MKDLIGIDIMHQKEFFHPSASHNCWEVVYYIEGTGKLHTDNRIINFIPGDIIYYPPGTNHFETSEEGYRNIGCTFFTMEYFKEDIYVFHDNSCEDYKQILLQLMAHNHNPETLNRKNITSALLSVLSEYIVSWNMKPFKNPLVEKCERVIIENLSNCNFKINDYLDTLPFTNTHFKRLFKKETGYTPDVYLFEKRMNYAMKLISNKNYAGYSMKEIAFRCGYNDIYYFSKSFKRKTRYSPTEWLHMESHT